MKKRLRTMILFMAVLALCTLSPNVVKAGSNNNDAKKAYQSILDQEYKKLD